MNHTLTRLAAGLTLGLAAFAAAPLAEAAMINYSFEVSGFGLGSQFGKTIAGSFAYDEDQTPSAGLFGEDRYALDSFSFTFNNVSYPVGDLTTAFAVLVGGQFVGLDAGAGTVFQFVPDDGVFPPSFAYALSDTDSGQASVTYATVAAPLPEPAMGALLAIALLGAGAARRLTARQ